MNDINNAPEKSIKKEMNFEEALARLEVIVRSLENGSAPLDDSLALFEEGVKLVVLCGEKLDKAEERIKILVNTPNGVEEKDFPKGGRND